MSTLAKLGTGNGAVRQQEAAPTTSIKTSDHEIPRMVGSSDVAVFWDYENVRIPAWCPASTAAEGIRNKVAKYGRIVEKRLYYDSRQPTEHAAPRSELDLGGFTLVDCPSRNRKETLDKKLIVDVLCFAWERASLGAKACVVLITSDGDYSYAMARLRDIGVFTIVIYRPDIVAKVLIDNANVVMSWEFDVLGGPPPSQVDEEEEEEEENAALLHNASLHDAMSPNVGTSDSSIVSTKSPTPGFSSAEVQSETGSKAQEPRQPSTTSPSVQTLGKFALFCSVVLNAQYRNVKEGISVYSSWADESNTAAIFYSKVGEKNREAYGHLRTLATQRSFIEWGRRNLSVSGKPVIKVKDREHRADDLSQETYLRLTYAGLAVLKPNLCAQESDWTMMLPKTSTKFRLGSSTGDGSEGSSNSSTTTKPKNGKLFVGGLAWQTTEDSLRSYFRQFGPLDTVVVMEGRGFGFVFFRNASDAETVLDKAGEHSVDNRSVE